MILLSRASWRKDANLFSNKGHANLFLEQVYVLACFAALWDASSVSLENIH
jgi:hypothetical protein